MIVKIIIAVLVSLTLNGCLSKEKIEGIRVLKQLSEGQKAIESSLRAKERRFRKLLAHIKEDKLKVKAGGSLESFIEAYGKPIVSRDIPSVGKRLLYRHPTDYFHSDKVYVYFDQQGKLIKWEYVPR